MERKILVEVSARHVHVSREHLDILFGKNYELTVKKELSQPGQYAANERVDIVGPKRELKNVSILGPVRKATQVEISMTDARSIGVMAPIRESGDTNQSAPCRIVGPKGEVELTEGVIVAKRHIHLTPEDAKKFNVKDKEIVSVKIETDQRSTILGDVVIRVREDFASAMHIDTDEGNAVGISGETYGTII
ncbi:MAG: phosphate propanoyltransferase [Candidatus Izemoplasmatales bacterium]|nr:phosphate propanoyltransferase [Candidatus Izemoplasmatales bacterium]MDD4069268.1 phosphate propanoyltransferase [Candidatus Izemoplasmatales bacterium]MDY0140011.1 phosphate propanoyltransferase [Candidatus Izemoplasmatales bacterium]